ncbi:multi-sensor hybrid histidine kinase [Calothrix brevissima NIES-22]|nr:multi-sensor hybrid histidine kinase [Calothrix brevissima NIES-22]
MNQQPRTVLIVDDSPEDRELYLRYLRRDVTYNYNFIHAELARIGLELWEQYQPDIVLLDYFLPDLDGRDFLSQLQTRTGKFFLPVIVVSGQGNEAIAVQAIKAGAQDYLVKGSMTADGLCLAVNTAIENIQLRNQLQQAQQQLQDELAERKRTERILQENEERLRLALEAAGMGTWDWNITTGEIQWSSNLEALFGLKPGEFDGSYTMFVSRLHPDDRDRVEAAINAAIATGSDYNLEFRIVYPNGNIRWALSQGKVFYDETGNPVRMAGIDLDITERKRSVAELQQTNTWLKLAQKATSSGLWDWNLTTGKIRIGEEFCRLIAIDPATREISYEDWLLLIQPEDRIKVNEYISRLIRDQQQDYDIEFRLLHHQGDRWIASRAKVFYDETGKAVRMTGNVQDINDRKLAEESLRESERRYANLAQAVPVAIFRFDADHNCVYVNDRWSEITGRPKQAALKSGWIDTLHPEDRDRFVLAASQIIQPGECYQNEGKCLRPDGTVTWFYSQVVAETDPNGNVIGKIGTLTDITELKRAEEELRQSEACYGYLAEAIPHLVWTCDARGECDYVNQRLCEYTGLKFESALGFGWLSAVHPDDIQRSQQLWLNAVETSSFYQHEYRFRRHADGSYRWHLILALPLKDEQGGMVKWFGTCTDIHDQKELEIERDRILQLEQEARNQAEKANRMKDEFLAVLSHELRSPLNPILGWTKLLQTGNLDQSKITEALATIERNAKLQTQLIDDLLNIARILRGKLSLNTKPVNLADIIEAAIETVKTAAIAKSIEIHPLLSDIGQVSGDAMRLQQIIWNLLSNAIKFTPNGGRVDICLERVGTQAQITVADTGKGMNPEFLPYIFESFRQEDVSITRKYGGLGLGLAIVRHLIEAHGGTVRADSPGAGQGARFTVTLPLLHVESESDRPAELTADILNLKGIKVLTIDDEADNRDLIAFLLAEYGAEAMTVASSQEFLAAIASFQPDIIVSDIGMPEVDGYTLMRQVRQLRAEQGGTIPAIALTAYAGEIHQQQVLAAGFQRHLSKPIDPDLLILAIAQLLGLEN